MKKILPINEKPYLYTYTYHGYLHSIISSNTRVLSELRNSIAEFQICDYDHHSWNVNTGDIRYVYDGKGFGIYGNQWNLNMNLTFWRECQLKDEVEIIIEKQLYANPWGSINLFISNPSEDMMNIDEKYVRAGNFSRDGLYYYVLGNESHEALGVHQKKLRFKLIRDDETAYLEYWQDQKRTRIKITDSLAEGKYAIGFSVNLGNSSYYEWLFMRYVNVLSNLDHMIPIDFLWCGHKNWTPHTSNYFCDFDREDIEDISLMDLSLLDYVKQMINREKYVEIWLNDNINSGVSDEDGKYFHQDLIYGYDDDEKKLWLLYYDQGVMKSTRMEYDDFNSERNNPFKGSVYSIRYCPAYEHIYFSPAYILQQFKEFKLSQNISFYEGYVESECQFGLKCYKNLTTEKGLRKLEEDIRISHFLYERALLNRDRVQYMAARGFIEHERVTSMLEILNNECGKTLLLRNMVIKKQMRGKVPDNKLLNMVEDIVNLEEEFLNLIIDALECFVVQ